jgi:hypothetical protein
MSFVHGYALIVGVGSYANRPQNNVDDTSVDAKALAEALADPRHCGYRREQVTLLQDYTATRDEILRALDELAAKVTVDDTMLFFFSGHGNSYGGHYYLPVHDTQYVDNRPTTDTLIYDYELLAKLRAINAKRMLLVFNTCHAGAVSPTLDDARSDSGQPVPPETAAALLSTGEGRIIITACRESQYSYIGSGPGTIVGRALVGALKGEGLRGDLGVISAYELYLAVYRRVGALVREEVPESTRKVYGETQEPELTVLKGVGPFAVALYQGAAVIGNVVPAEAPPVGAAVREVSREVSEQAYQKVMKHGIDFGQGNTVRIGGDVVGGDQRTTTVSGHYAKGNIDSRQGVFVEGGSTVSGGSIVGVNTGTLVIGGSGSTAPADPSLGQALAQVLQTVTQARQRGDDDLADDLTGVATLLQMALKAQTEGKPERRTAKIREAQEVLWRIAAGREELTGLAVSVRRLE